MRPAHAPCIRELEDAFGPRVERPVHRMAESRRLAAGGVDGADEFLGDVGGRYTGADLFLRLFEQLRAGLGRAE